MNFPQFVVSFDHWRSKRQITTRHRVKLSAPFKSLLAKGLITSGAKILDYGSGKGQDVEFLNQMGYQATPFDSYFCPNFQVLQPCKYEVVSLFFVLNVIEIAQERSDLIGWLWHYLRPNVLAIAVQKDLDYLKDFDKKTMTEIWLKNGAYQRLIKAKELTDLIKDAVPEQNYKIVNGGAGMKFLCRN